MTRIDISTSELHRLLKPVIPHASTDKKQPNLGVIRIELSQQAACAIATDRSSLAAERFILRTADQLHTPHLPQPVHVRAAEVKAVLAMFTYAKDYDPQLRLTIATVPVPIVQAGRQLSVNHLAVRIESEEGTQAVMHDQRDPSRDPLGAWRSKLAAILKRPMTTAAPALNLDADQLARWTAACRGAERLAVFTGTKGNDPVLIAVEHHFIGMWAPQAYLEEPAQMLADSAWADELAARPSFLQTASGIHVAQRAGTVTTINVEPSLFQQPAPPADDGDELGPWIIAQHDGPDCAGPCGNGIDTGDRIRADGQGGWLCQFCGADDDTTKDGE